MGSIRKPIKHLEHALAKPVHVFATGRHETVEFDEAKAQLLVDLGPSQPLQLTKVELA